MKKKKYLLMGAIALTMVASAGAVTAYAVTNETQETRSYIDNNGDGICDNRASYVDNDGDGICDNRANYVDEDGDGYCDNRKSGTGYENQNGQGNGRGNGMGNGMGYRRGCRR